MAMVKTLAAQYPEVAAVNNTRRRLELTEMAIPAHERPTTHGRDALIAVLRLRRFDN